MKTNLLKMKILLTHLLIILTAIVFQSCSSYSIISYQPDQMNGSDCPNPIYVATMSKNSVIIEKDNEGIIGTIIKNETLTLFALLEDAQREHGKDVTIHNIRWDLKNGKKKVSVIYDVVRCK